MFDFLEQNIGMYTIFACASATILAQFLKIIVLLIVDRKLNIKKFLATGGMPSSHSACVACLATMVGLLHGTSTIEFAITFSFALIVMHDAMSVRYSVGVQAKNLNTLTDLFQKVCSDLDEIVHTEKYEIRLAKIKELLGHSPLEVCMGGLLGYLFGLAASYLYSVYFAV